MRHGDYISNSHPRDILHRLRIQRLAAFLPRIGKLSGRFSGSRRLVRYGLIALNVLLLLGIGSFVINGTRKGQNVGQNAVLSSTGRENSAVPLDQVSSADIAANAALAAGLAETSGVINQAQSAQADLITSPGNTTAVAKPQAVSTALKSRKDIQQYVAQSGDTVAGIAAKFNVTSESIQWSNNLTGANVSAGAKLQIPPVNGIVYTVQAGDTLDSLASKYRANRDQLVAYNDAELNGIQTGEQILIPNGQLPAPVVTRVVSSATYAASGAYNGYDYGFCTWYVANRRAAAGRPVPSNLGNANTWTVLAASMGIATGSTPQAGAVAVKHSGAPGHVAYVEQVNDDGSFWISEMNSAGQVSMGDSTPRGGWGVVDWKLIPADATGTYSYVY